MERLRGSEQGFLLLGSGLGNPARKPLTPAQLRTLALRVQHMQRQDPERELEARDLTALGYGPDMAAHIVALLEEEELLRHYLRLGRRCGCEPITRATPDYPAAVRKKLDLNSPGVLWAKGDRSLLARPKMALVGSRDLNPQNRRFAEEAGRQAALQGYVLVSGNARGADQTAQNACLSAGGSVISVVADSLAEHTAKERVLYLSEDGYGEEFSAQRALSRNRVIHCLGEITFVAQCRAEKGGTWDGTAKNLCSGWSSVCCFDDGSEAVRLLCQRGASAIKTEQLRDFSALPQLEKGFL